MQQFLKVLKKLIIKLETNYSMQPAKKKLIWETVDFPKRRNKILIRSFNHFFNMIKTSHKAHIQKNSSHSLINTKVALSN